MVRFGVIGTNWITERFLDAASKVQDFSLTAVYSRTEEKAREFADKYDVKHTYTSLEEMAASSEIDAVYIASPNSLHAEQSILMMEHGKHVLCEKPAASNAAELKLMVEVSQRNKVVLMEALKSTLMPNFKAVQENLDKIGPVRRYFASYCQYSSRYDAYKEGTILNAFKPEFSNGALMDIGIYCIYPLVVLFGKPDEVKAQGVMLDSGVDGEGSMVLKYKEMDAVIMYSKITDSQLPAEIQGENGNIVIDKIHTPEKAEIRYRGGGSELITREQKEASMYYEAEEFVALVKSGKLESATNTLSNSLAVMEILDSVRSQLGIVYPADKKA
ncbi:Gfo/Idh/MocA family protein [Bacillus infantis]|uniref:Gfo/Idh/MocA family protein n=1 Tax=Bacillus infantis TaxID=324767 RepID=UPI003CF2F567